MSRDDAYADAPPFRRADRAPLLERTVPVTEDLRGIRPHRLGRDVTAGTTVAALAIPSAMAYGEIAGVSPINGLYALLLPTIAYVLLGSCKQLIVGPEGAVSTVVGAAIVATAAAGSDQAAQLAASLALLVAAIFALAWLLRLAWIADYFSRPVLIGYLHGVAVVLIVGQLGKLLGLSISARDPIPQLVEVVREIGDTSGLTILVSALSLAALFGLRAIARNAPIALFVVIAAIVASWALNLKSHGVAVVGPIPSGLPSIGWPGGSFSDIAELVPAAFGIFFVSFADQILTARAFAGRHHRNVRARQELLAMCAANAGAGLSQGFAVGASNSRTAVNDSMGARTQFAALAAATMIAVILLFLTEPVQYLPTAVLGSVIVYAATRLIEPDAWRSLTRVDRVEVAIAAVTMACVVIIGVLEAIVIAVGLSLIDAVRRSARPHDAVLGWVPELGRYGDVALHRSAQVTPGVVVYRLDDRLFFANARYFKGRVGEAIRGAPTPTDFLVLDAEAMTHVDSTGLEALAELGEALRRDGIELCIARLRTDMRDELRQAKVIGSQHVYGTVREAVRQCAGGS